MSIFKPIFTKKKLKNAAVHSTETAIFMGSELDQSTAFRIITSS